MRLRSITKHVKDQNWFAVALDFFIVVVGILIAFQITNWNEGRVTEREAVTARANLIADLKTDRDVYAVRRKFYAEIKETAISVENILSAELPETSEAKWQFIRNATAAGAIWPTQPSGQIYDQLLNSGTLNLVSNPVIQRQMRDYYQDAGLEAGVTFKYDTPYRLNSRSLIDWKLDDYAIAECNIELGAADPSNILEDGKRYFESCPVPDLKDEIEETSQRLFEAEGLISDIRFRIINLGTIISYIDYLDQEAAALITELEKQ